MRVWIKPCKEPDDENLTLVPYISDREIHIESKFRRSVVRRLLKAGCGVYGGCSPVYKEVISEIKRLHKKQLNETLLKSLQKVCTTNLLSGNLIFCQSRNFHEIILWLTYELSRGSFVRKDNLSWKQTQRKLGKWY